MNTYRHTFSARCPRNGDSIIFNLSIRTEKMIYVEHIKTACGMLRDGYHEHIAASLHEQFGGQLTLTANHHGVDIETVLGAGAKEREICAVICDELESNYWREYKARPERANRYTEGMSDGAGECASAIRAGDAKEGKG